MNPTILVIESEAVPLLQSNLEPNEEWFRRFEFTDPKGRVAASRLNDVVVIATKTASHGSRLLIIRLGQDNFFLGFGDDRQRQEVFRRILFGAQACFTSTVNLPRAWKSFKTGSRLSFHALPWVSSRNGHHHADRVELDSNPFGTKHVYVFNCSGGWSDIVHAAPDRQVFDEGVLAFKGFLSKGFQAGADASSVGAISLTDDVFFYTENNLGFHEWINSKLTSQQRAFVSAKLGVPIRLRGAPGTGKTLALAVKALKHAEEELRAGRVVRFLFLTSSTAAKEASTRLLASLDKTAIAKRVDQTDGGAFKVSTLFELVMSIIGDDLEKSGIYPISKDADEGRRVQLDAITDVLKGYLVAPAWKALKGLCSEQFRHFLEGSSINGSFRVASLELMNEFACVLDADGIIQKPDLRKRYLTNQRMAWMLPLPNEADRRVVLELYDRYVRLVSEMNSISIDQLVADYLNYLDSFRWNAVRDRKGYDVIFVDELHLFNRQERMVLHGLFRSSGSPSLYMAYDAKQSQSDTFMPNEERESPAAFWSRLGVGGIQKVELDKVFRYSPQIAEFISMLDRSFPALNLGEEWGDYAMHSLSATSEVPTVSVLSHDVEQASKVFNRARDIQRKFGQRFTVAVLCCNSDAFALYKEAGQYKTMFRVIASREEAAYAKPDAFRFVLSVPEYVAGLQFDCVLLVDVNKSEVVEGAYTAGLRRRFLSKVYLGASRAKSHLELYSVDSEGGRAPILDACIAAGVLSPVSFSSLPSANDVGKSL